MDRDSERERQRLGRDKRYQDRAQRQMEMEIERSRREIERLQQSIDRNISYATGREPVSYLTLDQDHSDLDYVGDTDREESGRHEQMTRRKTSFMNERSRDTTPQETPTFLKETGAIPKNILTRGSSTPYFWKGYETEEEKSDTRTEKDVQRNRKEMDRTPLPRIGFQDADSSHDQEVQISEDEEDNDERREEASVMERIKALQLQAERMAKESRQRISDENELKDKLRLMEDDRRKFAEKMERQNKILLMRQEEERLEKILELRREEERKEKRRLELLYEQEARMRREMEKDRQLQYRLERNTYQKEYTEPPIRTERIEQETVPKQYTEPSFTTDRIEQETIPKQHRETIEPIIKKEENIQERQREILPDIDREPQPIIEEKIQNRETDTYAKMLREHQYIAEREEELQRREHYLREFEAELANC